MHLTRRRILASALATVPACADAEPAEGFSVALPGGHSHRYITICRETPGGPCGRCAVREIVRLHGPARSRRRGVAREVWRRVDLTALMHS